VKLKIQQLQILQLQLIAAKSRLELHREQSELQNTTNFFALKKSSLMARFMQVAKHSLALRDKSYGSQIPKPQAKQELPFA
jgi:hypothetical protein